MLFACLAALSFSLTAQGDGVLASWQVPVWAEHDPDDTSVRVLEPGSRINLMSIACEDAINDPNAVVDDTTGEIAPRCFPARLRLPKGAYSFTGTSDDARHDMQRLHRCFDVRLVKAPAHIVASAAQHSLGAEPPHSVSGATPTALLVAYATTEYGWQRTFEFAWLMPTANGDEWATLAMPFLHPQEEVTIAIVEAPGARGIVAALHEKNYRGALKRAKAALAAELAKTRGDIAPDVKGALRANIAATAIFAGAKRDVVAVDDFNDTAIDSANGYVIELARRWAKGDVWLGPDPCAKR